jgi:hypothetical protein
MSQGPLPDSHPFLGDRVRHSAAAVGWTEVSREAPCPRCGATVGCEVSQDGCFVRCRLVVSFHPIMDGGWLHPIPTGAA